MSADTLSLLMASGLAGDALIEVVRSIDADHSAGARVVDATAERKREADRRRMRARREECPNDVWEELRQALGPLTSGGGHGDDR